MWEEKEVSQLRQKIKNDRRNNVSMTGRGGLKAQKTKISLDHKSAR